MKPLLVRGKGVIFVKPTLTPEEIKIKVKLKKILKKYEKQGTKSTVSQIMALFNSHDGKCKSEWAH